MNNLENWGFERLKEPIVSIWHSIFKSKNSQGKSLKTLESRGLLYSTIVGVFSYLIVVGASRLNPRNIGWIPNTYNSDTWQQYLGWEIFRNSEWSFPPGNNSGIYGMNSAITYTGGIAIFEIPLKFFSSIIGYPFQYLGLWLLTCFCLQSVGAWKILGLVPRIRTSTRLIGTIPFLFSPVLLWRVNMHLGLCAHFLLLFALFLSIKPIRTIETRKWALLLICGLAIHVYFVPMLLFMYLVSALKCKKDNRNVSLIRSLLGTLSTIVSTAYLLGYFGSSSGLNTGFPNSLFKMDLLQPFNISGFSLVLSRFLPDTIGNAEGFNFLGIWAILGLALILTTIKKWKSSFTRFFRQYQHILFATGTMALYSLSEQISIGRYYVQIHVPEAMQPLWQIFRASGRFFWPLLYFFYYLLILGIVKYIASKAQTYIFLVLISFHVLDTSYMWSKISDINNLSNPYELSERVVEQWEDARIGNDKVLALPDLSKLPRVSQCGNWQYIGYVSARFNLQTNCILLARYDIESLVRLENIIRRSIESEVYLPKTIYWFSDYDKVNFPSIEMSKCLRKLDISLSGGDFYASERACYGSVSKP